jgi:DeoR/GlpR family transcriptional regulator of sugar metabolism
MVAGAEHVVVVADGSKIGETALATVVPSNEIGTLVTDPSAPADELRELEANGVRVVLATTR